MKKSKVLILAVLTLTIAACKDSAVLYDKSELGNSTKGEIGFSNYVGGMTRASYDAGRTFNEGDEMEVWGTMKTGDEVDRLFIGQKVVNTGEVIWEYSPKKYWNVGSEYNFYAMFPYSDANSFDFDSELFSVEDFEVAENADEQVDLMIAQRILNAANGNTVDLVFNHILSNVGFFFKTGSNFNTDGIKSLEMVSFDVKNLHGKGSFAQTGWNDNNVFVGAWTADDSKYDLPQVTDKTFEIGGSEAYTTLTDDLLLLPQTIADDAVIEVVYKLNYVDGSASRFTKTVNLNTIVGKNKDSGRKKISTWEPNYRYKYILSIDPSMTSYFPNAKDDFDQDDYDDADDDDKIPNVTIIELDEDLDEDGMNDIWIDEDNDGNPDYPVIWKDIDGDGKEEGLPDRDNDGEPDDTDEDGNPDVIWMDTNGDNIVDTELQREVEITGKNGDKIDYNGAEEGYKNPTAVLIVDPVDGEYYVDTEGDGDRDYHVLWKNIDDDVELEGIADRDRDGKLTAADTFDNDGKDYLGNDNDFDVILIYREGDDPEWTELEKGYTLPVIPGQNEESNEIEFSAVVEDWDEEYESESEHIIRSGN